MRQVRSVGLPIDKRRRDAQRGVGRRFRRWMVTGLVVVVATPTPVWAAETSGSGENAATGGPDASATASPRGQSDDAGGGVAELRRLHRRVLRAVAAEQWERAELALAHIDDQLPGRRSLHTRLVGWYQLKRGRDQRAKRQFQQVLATRPGDENAALNLAYLHQRADRRDAAREVLEQALEHNPASDALAGARQRLRR